MTLKLLDESARNRLRSGVAIRSMAHCVGELVENSIDAGATCIAVRVDTTKFKIQVVDNGKGISREDLNLLGKRYMTSKCHTVDDLDHNLHYLGYRGEALASVVNISGVVEISSRHCLARDTYSRIFHNGKPMNVTLSKTHRPSVGTTITVHEFFYNMPVRRKVISTVLELEQVKKAVECIALVNPSRSFSLRNDITGECILQTRKTYSVLTNFGLIFGGDKVANMKEVRYTHGDFVLTGFMSTEGHYNKLLQFIYVNGRIVKKTPLHSTVNSLLANSLLSRKLSRQIRDQPSQDRSAEMISPKRAVEVHGVYILLLKCSRSAYDVCLEPAKTLIEFQNWSEVLLTFEMMVKQFLSKHNLTLGPAIPIRTEEDKIQAQQNSLCDSTMETKQPPHVTARRQPVDMPLIEMKSSLQSRVVRCPKKFSQQQTSTSLTTPEEPSCMEEEDTGAVVTHHPVQADSSLPTFHSQEFDCPPGATLCMVTTRLQPEAEHHDSSRSTSYLSSTTITQSSNTNSTSTCCDIEPVSHPHFSQPMTHCNVHDAIYSKPSSHVSARPLNRSHSNLNQKPNSLFLTSFYSRTNPSKELITATETQSVPHTSSCQNRLERSQGTGITVQPKLQTFSHHPMQLLSSAIMPSQNVPQGGPQSSLPSAKKIALGLNVPVRSPLQSSPGSSKLACLFRKGQQTRKGSGSYCTTVTQPSNLSQDLRQSVIIQPDASRFIRLPKTNETLASNSIAEITHQPVSNSHLVINTGALQLPLSVPTQSDTRMAQPCVENVCGVESMSTELENNATDVEMSGEPLVLSDTSLSPRLKALVRPTEELHFLWADNDDDKLNIESHTRLTTSSPVTIHSLPDYNHQFYLTGTTCSSETDNLSNICSSVAHSSLSQSELEYEPSTSYLPCTLEESGPINDHSNSHQDANTDNAITDSMPEYNAEITLIVDEVATSKPIWKECIDPVSKKKIFIHSKTGNVCTSKPTEYTSSDPLPPPPVHMEHNDTDSRMNTEDSGLGDSLRLDSSSISSTPLHTYSDKPSFMTTFGAKPLRAAPHLSHDFASFLPRPKHLRTSFASSESLLDSTNTTLQSILSESCADTVGNKWRNNKEVDELHQGEGASSNNSFAALLDQWENPTFQPGDMDVLNVARDGRQRGQVKVHRVINQYKFTKEMFNNFKVLAQVDNKFIACLVDTKNNGVHDLLVMVDQHAAHERIRLEELLNNLYDVRQESSQPLRIKSSQIQPPLSIALQPTEIRLAKLFRQQLEATGVCLLFDRGHVRVSSLPSVLMEREVSEVKRGRPAVAATILQEMIVKHLELLQTTSGGCSTVPSALIHVLNSQACHGAIKFGDPLTFSECESLIQSLSQCKLPFQCAHGRPSLIPILDMDILNQRYPVTQTAPCLSLKKLKDHQK